MNFEEKDPIHTSNILGVIESKKWGYLNARKLPFYNTLQESLCSRVRNTDEFCIAALLSYFSINGRQK